MTIDEAIESMRLAVNEPAAVQCQMMRVLADVWWDHEAAVRCEACSGNCWVDQDDDREIERGRYTMSCPACHGAGVVSNGNAARGDALELLGECGKVGESDRYWVGDDDPSAYSGEGTISRGWYEAAIMPIESDTLGVVVERIRLMDAYAAANQETRERWAAETRALVPKAEVVCEGCYGAESHGFAGNGNWRRSDCPNCHGTGKVTRTEVT